MFPQIFSGSFKGNVISSISDKLLQAGKVLERITPTRQHCLRTFTECFELVTWLRQNIKGKDWPCITNKNKNKNISFLWKQVQTCEILELITHK